MQIRNTANVAALIRKVSIITLCLGVILLLALQASPGMAATAIDPLICNKAATATDIIDVEVPGVPYGLQLTAPNGTDDMVLITCAWVGAAKATSEQIYTFTLFDLNGGDLKSGDKVVIKGSHGRLIGLDSKGELKASRKYYAANEVFTIKKVGSDGNIAAQDKIALIARNGKHLTADTTGRVDAKADTISDNETFSIKKLTAPTPGKLKAIAGKVIGPMKKIAGYAFKILPPDLIKQLLTGNLKATRSTDTKSSSAGSSASNNEACTGTGIIPDEPQDADTTGFAQPAPKTKKAFAKVWGKMDQLASCGKISFEATIPTTDITFKTFYTKGSGADALPVWHVALMAGPETLNNNIFTQAVPGLKDAFGGLKVKRLVSIISGEQGTLAVNDLGAKLGALLKDYQTTTVIPGKFKDAQAGTGNITLQPGANLFAEVDGPKTGLLAVLSEAALPGSTKSTEPWKISGVMGGALVKALIGKVSKFDRAEEENYNGKTAFSLDVWLPGHTPFPFSLTNNKNILHAEVEKARLRFDLSKSSSAGATSTGVSASIKSWVNYWLINKELNIVSEGNIAIAGNDVSGSLDGLYTVDPSNDPFGFIPGLNIATLRVGGAISKTKDQADLNVSLASSIKVGNQPIESTLDLIVETKGTKANIKELRVSLSGENDQPIQVKDMGLLGQIPLANQLELKKGVIGIMPLMSGGFPDFYIKGGVTFKLTGQGGEIAVLKRTPKGDKEQMFIFVTQNDFSLANLLPETDAMKTPKAILTVLKMPKTMLMFTSMKKDGELKVSDFPEPVQPMFEGLVAGAAGDEGDFKIDSNAPPLKIFGDSLSIVAALDFTPKETTVITQGFEQLGLSKFGPTGPLLASGSIGGLQGGALSISFGAKLPGFEFPKKVGGQDNPVALLVEPQGVGFFVELIGGAISRVEAGIDGDLRLNLPRLDDITKTDAQDLKGRIYLKGTSTGQVGIFASAEKGGDWTDPLGMNANITIKDTAIVMGIVASATGDVAVNVGLGGSIIFNVLDKDDKPLKLQYDGDIIIGGGVTAVCPPCVTPTLFGLNLGADKISADTAVRVADAVLDGILKGGMANLIIDGDPNNPLAPGLPAGPVKDGVNNLRNLMASQSLPKLLLIDQIPLPGLVLSPPTGEKNVRFYIATPGATIPGREETMNGLGFILTGAASLDLLGKNYKLGETAIKFTAAEGFRVYGQIEPIAIGALKIGAKPDYLPPNDPKGARKAAFNPAGGTAVDIKASLTEGPSFMFDGYVALGDAFEGATLVKLSLLENSFYMKRALGPKDKPLFSVELDVNASVKAIPPKFTVDAKIDNGINNVVRSVFTTLGMPDPAVNEIMSVNPVVIDSFSLKSDVAGFVTGTGDPIEVKIKPTYFGEERPLIEANVKAIDWKNPANVLLNGQELPNAILGSLIDYMIDHPEKAINLKGFNLGGIIGLDDGKFGGAKRPYRSYKSYKTHMKDQNKPKLTKANWESQKPQEGVFKLLTGSTLLGSHSALDMEITPRDIGFTSTVSLLDGALESKITALGPIENRIVTDMKFRAEFTSGIDDFVANTLMPGLGIPQPVVDGIKGALPLLIKKVDFEGEVAGIVTGDKPITVYMQPVFFGDTAYAKKNGKTKKGVLTPHIVKAVLPKLDLTNPAKSLLAGPEVIKALTVAMVEYLIDNPQTLPAIDLGLLKFDESVLGGVNVKGFYDHTSTKKTKVFQIKAGLESFLSKPKADMMFSGDRMELNFEDKLLDGIIQSKYAMSGNFKDASLNMHGTVKADLNIWLKANGLGAVSKEFDKLNPGFAKARKDLIAAQNEVNKLDKDIVAKREVVKTERKNAVAPVKSAEAEVAKLQSQITSLNSAIASSKSSISSCKQTSRPCALWKPYRSGWKIKYSCARRITIPNLPARAVCEVKNTPYRAKIVADAAALASVVSAKAIASKTLETIRKGITNFPIDLDPRVAALLTARIAATVALTTARIAVEGANIANTLLPLGLKALSSGGAITFKKGDLYGRFPEVLKGEPMVFDIKYKLGSKTINDRVAFSTTDAAFNTRQMEVIALGVAVDAVVASGKKLEVIPHGLLNQVENLYHQRKAEADAELARVMELNPLIPAIERSKSLSASIQKDNGRRMKAQARAIEKEKRAKAKIMAMKEKIRTAQLKKAEKEGKKKAEEDRLRAGRLPDGWFNIHSVHSYKSSMCIDTNNGNTLAQPSRNWPCTSGGHPNMQFKAAYQPDGKTFKLVIKKNQNLCIHAAAHGNPIIQHTCDYNGIGQLWQIQYIDEGQIMFKAQYNNLCMGQKVNNGRKGSLIHLWDCNDKDINLRFTVKPR